MMSYALKTVTFCAVLMKRDDVVCIENCYVLCCANGT